MLHKMINRTSCGRLKSPAPTSDEMELLFKAALRAPDHKGLKPWKYLVYSGKESLNQLGSLFLKASLAEVQDSGGELEPSKQERIASLPHRAPMVIVAIAKNYGHEKVPHVEEVLSTGAGVQNILLGAYDLGYGAYWRTGPLCFNRYLKALLGAEEKESIVGFIYLGTPDAVLKPKAVPDIDAFVEYR